MQFTISTVTFTDRQELLVNPMQGVIVTSINMEPMTDIPMSNICSKYNS